MNNNKGKKLYQHQVEMVKSTENSKGILVAPTGSGKTLVQAEITAQEILKGGFRVILVKTPRILLSNQVAGEYVDHFYNGHDLVREEDYNSILVHSGKSPAEREDAEDDDSDMSFEEWAEIENQLSNAYSHPESIKNLITAAKERDIPFVIFTTYHSNVKAWDCISDLEIGVDLDINDEGHYLVRNDFTEILTTYTPVRQYFFTATMRVTSSDEGKGMNNTDLFGDIIYNMPIAEAIESKLILPVKPFLIKAKGNVDYEDEEKGIGEIVDKAFDDLLEKSDLDAPSLLVATTGGDQIHRFIKSSAIRTLLNKHNDLHILTVHSNKELITHNGETISREEFDNLRKEIGEDDTKKMIMMHYDILSEGIDVAGLTGVVILRNMNEAKFLQTIGRCVRLYRKDPARKTHGFVYFPDINNKDLRDNFFELLLRSVEAGYIPSEFVSEIEAIGKNDEEDVLEDFGPDSDRSIRKNLRLFVASGLGLDKKVGNDIF